MTMTSSDQNHNQHHNKQQEEDTCSLNLTVLQRLFFWAGCILPIPSIILYEFVTDGTIEYFGGTVTPTSLFWCSIAASADAVIVVLCASVLWHPTNLVVRRMVLRAFAVYSIFHWGGFLRARYSLFSSTPNAPGPAMYIGGIVATWAAYIAWSGDVVKMHLELSGKNEASTVPTGSSTNSNNNINNNNDDFSMEDSPSYEILNSHNLLTKKYRVASEADLVLESPNSSRIRNTLLSLATCPCFFLGLSKGFEVPNGSIKLGYNGRGDYVFFGAGVHQVLDPYYTVERDNTSIASQVIFNGDRSIVTVDQGFIGYCMERGQPVLLPPGMHQWKSSTLKFVKMIDLNQPVIKLGPWTLLTIDQGYMAVTQNNGKQTILEGGSVYLLTHRNHKFEKFVSTKIETDELKRIEAASADNVIMLVDATVLWRVSDVDTAVRMSVKTMNADGSKAAQTTTKLRNDILKQASASLAYFVGTINFSDSMAAAAVNQRSRDSKRDFPVAVAERASDQGQTVDTDEAAVEFNLYNNEKLDDAVSHANEITKTYGVEIISINIISAIPGDKKLQESLAAGAVAAAESQMMETTAQGKSRAIKIEAKAKAEQTMILAKADADADILRAEGAKQAADLLSTNAVSVDLAKIDRTGRALAGEGNHASFFFGAQPQDVQNLLANCSVVKGPSE